MIDAKELRIGNLVNHGYEISKVNMIRGNDIGLYDSGLALWGTTVDRIEGVPLTEDILLKAGFYHSSDIGKSSSFFFIMVGGSELHINPNEGVVWIERDDHLFNNPALIIYLHQLQNLYFALTGTELNIQL